MAFVRQIIQRNCWWRLPKIKRLSPQGLKDRSPRVSVGFTVEISIPDQIEAVTDASVRDETERVLSALRKGFQLLDLPGIAAQGLFIAVHEHHCWNAQPGGKDLRVLHPHRLFHLCRIR